MSDENLYFHVARLAWRNAYPDCTKNETIWPANIWCSTSVLDCWFYPHTTIQRTKQKPCNARFRLTEKERPSRVSITKPLITISDNSSCYPQHVAKSRLALARKYTMYCL